MKDGNAWVGRSGIEELIGDVQPLLDSPETPSIDSGRREPPSSNGTAAPPPPHSSPLTATSAPYYDLISSSEFSIFDYRTYIFRRQIAMLGELRQAAVIGGREDEKRMRAEELARRGLGFILGLGRWLQENAVSCMLPTMEHCILKKRNL